MPTKTVRARGLDFGYHEMGTGPLALCLHGFPDGARTWRHLLPVLADAGFHAVAPWNRGYAPTALAPDGFYQAGAVAADANALHEALGGDGDGVIIGHDWGAIATYGAAGHAPDRWRRTVALAVPPTAAMGSSLFTFEQLKRSWYMFFVQHPLAEMVVGADDLAFLDRLWQDWSPGYDGAEDLEQVKEALRPPGALAAALGIYRASLGNAPVSDHLAGEQAACGRVPPQPTLYLHGRDDGCIGLEVAEAARPAFDREGDRFEIVEDAGHWPHLEQPDRVDALILDFLTR